MTPKRERRGKVRECSCQEMVGVNNVRISVWIQGRGWGEREINRCPICTLNFKDYDYEQGE